MTKIVHHDSKRRLATCAHHRSRARVVVVTIIIDDERETRATNRARSSTGYPDDDDNARQDARWAALVDETHNRASATASVSTTTTIEDEVDRRVYSGDGALFVPRASARPLFSSHSSVSILADARRSR